MDGPNILNGRHTNLGNTNLENIRNEILENNSGAIGVNWTEIRHTYNETKTNRSQTLTNIVTTQDYVSNPPTVTEKTDKNSDEPNFVTIYLASRSAKQAVKDLDSWLFEYLEMNDDTKEMVDLTKYLLYMATGKSYGVENYDFESIWKSMSSNSFNSVSSTSLMEFIQKYVHSLEGSTEINADKTKYKIQDDGVGHPTVGYGIDIENSGFKDRFIAAGYPTTIGGWVDIEFVDSLELEKLQDGYDKIVAETSGLNLKEYQIAALVSRYYNAGSSGWKITRNGKNFRQAYTAYWNDSKTEEYYGQSNNEKIYSESMYTTYMNEPTMSAGKVLPGLVNRRKSEWKLFTTGYADTIDVQWSDNMTTEGDIVSVATRIHQYIRENQYAYSCSENVSNGYVNTCTKNGTSAFGKSLNANTIKEWYNMRCIDCSAYVSWVLYESGIDIGRQRSTFFYNGNYTSYTQYNWKKITDWNDLQPGDILVRDRTCRNIYRQWMYIRSWFNKFNKKRI